MDGTRGTYYIGNSPVFKVKKSKKSSGCLIFWSIGTFNKSAKVGRNDKRGGRKDSSHPEIPISPNAGGDK